MTEVKVTIILPVYNVEKYIAKSISSILKQTYTNFELLIINDGTLDNSIEIAKQFSDSRIKILNKENGGLSDARNFGLERATGEYVFFMDSDDWIEPNLLETCVIEIEKYNGNFIVFGFYLDREDYEGNKVSTQELMHNEIVYERNKKNLKFQENTLALMGFACNKLYRTSFLIENSMQFEKGISLIEDILFNSKVYEISDRIIFIEKVLYHYNIRPVKSITQSFHLNSFQLKIRKNRAIEVFLKEWNVPEIDKNRALANSLFSGIKYCIHNLFTFKNSLSIIQKVAFIRMMLFYKETQKLMFHLEAKSFKDKIYKKLITSKAIIPLYLIGVLKKISR